MDVIDQWVFFSSRWEEEKWHINRPRKKKCPCFVEWQAMRVSLFIFCGRHSSRKKGDSTREQEKALQTVLIMISFISLSLPRFCFVLIYILSSSNNVSDLIVYVGCGQIYICTCEEKRRKKGWRMYNGKDMILD